MALDRSDVAKIAHLVRLAVDENALDDYAAELSSILDLVEQMRAVDTGAFRGRSGGSRGGHGPCLHRPGDGANRRCANAPRSVSLEAFPCLYASCCCGMRGASPALFPGRSAWP